MTIRAPALKSQVELLKAAMLQAGNPIASGVAHEIVAKLNGYPSWNNASKAGASAKQKDLTAKGFSSLQLSTAYEVNMAELLDDYDTPEGAEAWEWLEDNACFAHKENGNSEGIWEFFVRLEAITANRLEIPSELQESFKEAQAANAKWILFYQW